MIGNKFQVGDCVQWNSQAGIVSGIITRIFDSEVHFKGYTRHASKNDPQYLIRNDKSDHEAMHKASALKKLRKKKSH